MSLRISSAVLSLMLAGCGGPSENVVSANVQEVGSDLPAEPPAERVACAQADDDYRPVCTIERLATHDGTIVTVRHPDGGFRRLRLRGNGSVVAADGAVSPTVIARSDANIDVAIGDMRYRLPLK